MTILNYDDFHAESPSADLMGLVSEYLTLAPNNHRLLEPEYAFNRCVATSKKVVKFLRSKGIKANVLQFMGFRGSLANCSTDWSTAYPHYGEYRLDFFMHYATLVGDTVVDLTYRQFDDQAPFPLIVKLKDIMVDWNRAAITG